MINKQPNWQKEFDERYFDKNTPSGLNQKFPFLTFIKMVKDIKQFITKVESEAREEERQLKSHLG